jgi:ABC-type glycerol-3-phosphate transport system permease component
VPSLGALGGYALSRFRFKGSEGAGYLILVTQMLPTTLTVIPIYLIFKSLALLDTRTGLVIAYTTFALPYCLWMMKGFFDTIPRDIEEAAQMDGCSRVSSLFRVVLPLSIPGLVATSLFAFILAWDEYLFGITLLRSAETRTIAVGIATFIGEYGTPWDLIMTTSVIATIPVLLMFLFLQRYLLQGLTAGAVKG